jgi:hypothetical protein
MDRRRFFPESFLPPTAECEERSYPEGPAIHFDGDLFKRPQLKIGEDEFLCNSAAEASYLAYAHNCGRSPVRIPTEPELVEKAVAVYKTYAQEMVAKLYDIIPEIVSNKRVAKAVRKEALRLLGIVEELAKG